MGELSRTEVFGRGAREVLPIAIGIIPFGLIAGVAALEAGLGLVEAVGFSTIVFAGAAQLAALDLLGQDAFWLVAVGTALVINSRMLMYSGSLAPWFARVPRGQRLGAAYLLVDQSYALSINRYQRAPAAPHRLAYFLGVGATMWIVWQISTIVGAVLGGTLPESVPLGFAVPMVFLVMLIPAVTDRPTAAAGAVSGVVAVVAAPLPANLGMPVAAVAGIGAGVALSRARQRV